MKTRNIILIATAAALLLAFSPSCVRAQTVTNAPALVAPSMPPLDPASFFTSVENYFTSFNTNVTTFSNPVDLWIADNYRSGINSSAEIGGSYDVWKVVSVEAVMRNAAVAGTVVNEQAGVGLNLVHFDVKLTAFLDFGYSEFDSRGYAEFGLRAKKSLTDNTYGGIGVSLQELFGHSRAANVNTTATLPTFTAYIGCTIPGW